MAEFIELTETKGNKILINSEHVLKVRSDDNGCFVYFDVATGNDSTSLSLVHVLESYATVKKKLQL